MATPVPEPVAVAPPGAFRWRAAYSTCTVSMPWRRAEPSITSSWIRAAVCSISRAAPASMTAGSSERRRRRPRKTSSRRPAGAACPRTAGDRQRLERGGQLRVDAGPPLDLGVEQAFEPALAPSGRRTATATGRAGPGVTRHEPSAAAGPARFGCAAGGRLRACQRSMLRVSDRASEVGHAEQQQAGDHVGEVVVGGHDDAEDGRQRVQEDQTLPHQRPDEADHGERRTTPTRRCAGSAWPRTGWRRR